MTAPVFVDTSVLVYSRDSRVAAKQERAEEWLGFLWDTRRGRISRQVLHEYYVTVTRKLKPGLPIAEARADARALFHWMLPVEPARVIEAAWAFQDRCALSFWDALIVGAAESLGCTHVLSEDLPSGQDLGGIKVINPFAQRPGDLADVAGQ
jgi:predicted nucleic acid-binding protein